MILDKDLKMTEHVKQVVARANEVFSKLGRLMPNIGGRRSSKRRVLSGAVSSIVLYGAPIWGGIISKEKYRQILLQVQRKSSLRISSASVSTAQVLAELIPMDVLVRERVRTHDIQEWRENLRRQTMADW